MTTNGSFNIAYRCEENRDAIFHFKPKNLYLNAAILTTFRGPLVA